MLSFYCGKEKKETVNINFKLHLFASFTNSVLYWVYIYVVHIFTLCFFSSSYIAYMIGHGHLVHPKIERIKIKLCELIIMFSPCYLIIN